MTRTRTIYVVGAGGHARPVLALLAAVGGWRVAGVLDRPGAAPRPGEEILGHRVTGSWDALEGLEDAPAVALALGDNDERAEQFARVTRLGLTVPTLVHPTAFVDPSATLGPGCVVCMGALIGAAARVGADTIVNSGAILDHEVQVGEHAHLCPGTRLAGRVTVGERTFIGIGATVREKISIGKSVTVGAGAVVVSDLPDGVTAVGVPARVREES